MLQGTVQVFQWNLPKEHHLPEVADVQGSLHAVAMLQDKLRVMDMPCQHRYAEVEKLLKEGVQQCTMLQGHLHELEMPRRHRYPQGQALLKQGLRHQPMLQGKVQVLDWTMS